MRRITVNGVPNKTVKKVSSFTETVDKNIRGVV